jgi:hypothetical protein
VVADAGHDVAEVVQVVVGQGVEQQAAGEALQGKALLSRRNAVS